MEGQHNSPESQQQQQQQQQASLYSAIMLNAMSELGGPDELAPLLFPGNSNDSSNSTAGGNNNNNNNNNNNGNMGATPGSGSGGGSSGDSPDFAWKPDSFDLDQGYLDYRQELRDLIFSTGPSANDNNNNCGGGGVADDDDDDGADEQLPPDIYAYNDAAADHSRAHRETGQILSDAKSIAYLKNYITSVAPWLDMFDGDRAFGLQMPNIARKSPALLYAMLGISARQLERKQQQQQQQQGGGPASNSSSGGGSSSTRHAAASSLDSLELYQEAIRLLAPLFLEGDLIIIPICVILCCLEMMSASAQDWRRHLEGCAALFSNFGVHGFSGGLLQAVFWCYTRMDLCGALISDGTEGTLLPSHKWHAPGTTEQQASAQFLASGSPDTHANYSVWIAAKVTELVSRRTRFRELGEANGCDGEAFATRWRGLWEELRGWRDARPHELRPAAQTVVDGDSGPFPQILFSHWAAISSTQLNHTACILLLDIMPPASAAAIAGLPAFNLSPGDGGDPIASAVWHAKRICGISLANAHEGCLNNAIQPLWIAGRLLSHKSEHYLIVKLIWNIEALTGWGITWRIADLETAWGYKVRKA